MGVADATTGVVLPVALVAVAETGAGVALGMLSCWPIWRFAGVTVGLAAMSAGNGTPCAEAMAKSVSPAFTM